MKKFKIMETFVGAGGSHIGFKQWGFKSVYVNDIDKDCLNTLVINNPELIKETYIDDRSILDIETSSLLKLINLDKYDLDVSFAGIVCKGFSLAGERSPNDERNYFYHKQLEIVDEVQPKISIIENVKGILNAKVLSSKTPIELKNKVDQVWQEIENFKGKKADLRKKNLITSDIENYGNLLRVKKEKVLKDLESEGYLISVLDDIYEIYNKIGYRVSHKVLNSAWYGCSTKRERVIIVAIRNDLKGDFSYPLPKYHSSEIKTKLDFEFSKSHVLKKPITIGDALNCLDVYNEKDFDNIPMNHSKKTIERFKFIPKGGNISNEIENLPDELKISKFYSRGNTMRLDFDKLAPTLVPGHSNFPVHPLEHRSITVREAALITGFPKNYKFIGSHTKRCEHVGNAVPPPLAAALAEQCKIFLENQIE